MKGDTIKAHIKAVFALIGIFLIVGCIGGGSPPDNGGNGNGIPPVIDSIQTFYESDEGLCENADGKPLILLFSTTRCPHCKWIGPTFEKVAYEYISAGKIEAHHYKLDTGDDSITPEVEEAVPQEHLDIYQRFNPRGTVPTFVFGCRYSRVGNGYEAEDDLASEEAEFRLVIDTVLGE